MFLSDKYKKLKLSVENNSEIQLLLNKDNLSLEELQLQ
jgi:hypothetical protein